MKASTAVVVPQSTGFGRPIAQSAEAGGDAEGDVDQAHRADEEADVALRLAHAGEDQRARARPAHAATVRVDQPALGGEQEVEQDHRRRRRERERERLADRQRG